MLDSLIPPEIKNDDFYNILNFLARHGNFSTILEIGSSSGEGSTEAFVRGIQENPHKPTLFGMEISKVRFEKLAATYVHVPQFHPYWASSVGLDGYPSEEVIAQFYNGRRTAMNQYPLDQILGWYRRDIAYIADNQIPTNGIDLIKSEHRISSFDFVLIDGSAFTGKAELDKVYGSRVIALDDILTYKNYENFERMSADSNYDLYVLNKFLRHGYAIFVRR